MLEGKKSGEEEGKGRKWNFYNRRAVVYLYHRCEEQMVGGFKVLGVKLDGRLRPIEMYDFVFLLIFFGFAYRTVSTCLFLV